MHTWKEWVTSKAGFNKQESKRFLVILLFYAPWYVILMLLTYRQGQDELEKKFTGTQANK